MLFSIPNLTRVFFPNNEDPQYYELPGLGVAYDDTSSVEVQPPAYSDLSSISEAGSDSEDLQPDADDVSVSDHVDHPRRWSMSDAAIDAVPRMRLHHWLLMRGTRYDSLPEGVLHTKRLFRALGFVCLFLSMVCMATAVSEPRWIDNIDTHQHLLPTHNNIDGHMIATRNSPPLPRSLGLWVQCSRENKRGCVPVRPGQREVRYSLNYREVSAVALDSIVQFRAVQLSMLTATVTLVAKSALAVVYLFSRRWKPVIWLRYSLLVMSALETLLLVVVMSVFHTLHQNIGAGDLSIGAGFAISALVMCILETICFLLGVCHFSLTVEVDKPSRFPPHRFA